MKKLCLLIPVIMLLAACHHSQQWMKDNIDSKEKALIESAKSGTDTNAINNLLAQYQAYTTDYPSDTNGADYLFKAADFYRYMHQPLQSIKLYDKVYSTYPTLSKRPYALFLQGFMYENELHNLPAAKQKYEQFINEYPNHPFAKDVRITLNNLGKTPEQLIQEFEAKQKADSAQVVRK